VFFAIGFIIDKLGQKVKKVEEDYKEENEFSVSSVVSFSY
jgi:hypothetical protein